MLVPVTVSVGTGFYPFLKESRVSVEVSGLWPAPLMVSSDLTGPTPGAAHSLIVIVEVKLPTCATMVMFTSVAWYFPADVVTDWVPPPWTVTSAVSNWPEVSLIFDVEWVTYPEARSAAFGQTIPLPDTTVTPWSELIGNPIWPLS